MNLHLGHLLQDDTKEVQKHFVASFFTDEEVARLNRFVQTYGEDISVFFRGQLLELMRWVALLSTDQSEDGTTFNDPAVRHRFARAVLLAGDVWGRRIYPDGLRMEGDLDATRRRILAMLRQSDIETSPGPHPLLALARGVCVGKHLLRRMPDADEDLQRAIGLTFEDYFSIVACVAAMSLSHSIADFRTPEKNGLLSLGTIEQGTTPFGRLLRSYFSHESQSPDELRRALWQERTDSEESGAGRFLFTPLRAKPLLKTRGDQAVIIDPTLFAERPTAGPLFHLARSKRGGQANRLFAAFGDAFEDYVRDVMRRIFREGNDTPLARRYVHNPKAVDKRGHEIELADGLLLEHDVAVLLEAKAVWIKEDLSSPDADPGRYIEHLRCRRARENAGIGGRRGVGRRPGEREMIAVTAKE